jgi:hypothetical protein
VAVHPSQRVVLVDVTHYCRVGVVHQLCLAHRAQRPYFFFASFRANVNGGWIMTIVTETETLTYSLIESFFKLAYPETRRLVTVGRQHGWDVRVLGQAPMPTQPIWLPEHVIVPAHQDTSDIPDHAMEKLKIIFAEGLRPKGFVVVHETPKLLPAPVQPGQEEAEEADPAQLPSFPLEGVKTALKIVAIGLAAAAILVGAVIAIALVVAAALAIAAALVIPAAAVTAIAVDPILIAVTDDGYWIEIDRWDV